MSSQPDETPISPTTSLEAQSPTPDGEATETASEPEFHLDSQGKVRYIWMKVGTAVFRERVPLHVFKMDEERKRFHLEQIADRLKNQLFKDIRRFSHDRQRTR